MMSMTCPCDIKFIFPTGKCQKSQLDDFWLLTGEAWAVMGTGLNLRSNSE